MKSFDILKYSGFTALIIGIIAAGNGMRARATDTPQPLIYDVVAPELVGGPWLNTPDNKPITLKSRNGKVTLVEYWTFGCFNCRNNLPSLARLQKRFANKDVQILAVHTPETEQEKISANVEKNVKKLNITYPVLLDQKAVNWENWKQRFWPTVYLIDKKGHVRFEWDGELEYQHAGGEEATAKFIEKLLAEK